MFLFEMALSHCSGCAQRPNPLWLCLSPPLVAPSVPHGPQNHGSQLVSIRFMRIFGVTFVSGLKWHSFLQEFYNIQTNWFYINWFYICIAMTYGSMTFGSHDFHFHFCKQDKLQFYLFSGGVRVSKHVYDAREWDVGWEASKSLMARFPHR